MKTRFPFRRAVGGVLVAALAASIVLSASFSIVGLLAFPIVYFLTAMIGALMALPLYWLLHRTGIARGWMAPPAGLLAGIAGMLWFDDPSASHPLLSPSWYAAAGLAGGIAFWWRLRPSSPGAAPPGSSPPPPGSRP